MKEIIPDIISSLLRIVWNKEARAKIQKLGVNVVPSNFYSNTPSIEEIENSFEYNTDEPPYLNCGIFEDETLRRILDQLLEYSREFNPPENGNENKPTGFFWGNSQFSYSDAMSYYCFLRLIQPSNILEIGSGFSTLVALEACEVNKSGTIHCIEPYPRQFLVENEKINLHAVKAQEINPEFLNDILKDNDVLFIDSTHTVKTGSDCLHIYLRLLPKVRRKIYVHVHDIFLPDGMPQQWLLDKQIYWTEQYLLLAFLLDNKKASVLYGSNCNVKMNPLMMERLMDGKCLSGGSSLWFSYEGGCPESSLQVK